MKKVQKLINASYPFMGQFVQVPTRSHITTALSHAKDSMDWEFVRWLLKNGADPNVKDPSPTSFTPDVLYSIGISQTVVESTYQDIITEVKSI